LKKVTAFVICTILILIIFLPATSEITSSNKINNISNKYLKPKDKTTKLKFMIAGEALRSIRSYFLHVPSSYDGCEPVPLVLVLHGYTKMWYPFHSFRSSWIEKYTNFSGKADEEGFIAVYPNAKYFFIYRYFGWDYEIFPAINYFFVDDIGFIRELIEKMEKNYNINSSRIYVTGLSGGAIMTYSLGAHLSDKVAAIAPVAGTIGGAPDGGTLKYVKPPENPVPAIIFHGTNDTNVPYEGSSICASVNESVSFWVNHTGCNPEPEINISQSGKIIKRTYKNNSNDMEVILYATVDGGHWWPGSDIDFGWKTLHDSIQEIDATDLIWEFFRQHPKQVT